MNPPEMEPERWARVREVFLAALEREPSRRAEFLAESCGGDHALRQEVESLISAHEDADNFLETGAPPDAGSSQGDGSDPPLGGAAKAPAGGPSAGPKPRPILRSGSRLGAYEIVRLLGWGGMGQVYLAHDARLERNVALKVLRPEVAADPDRRERFLREARAVSALNHPNVCTIHEIGSAQNLDYICFEYIEGQTLVSLLRQGGLSAEQLVELALPMAGALAYAHGKGVLHRDLKPANVMVTEHHTPKILDFGLAKLLSADSGEEPGASLSKTGMVLGTVAYMSPEQALGRRLDERSDIFSFGAVLYEMATGRQAFVGETQTEVLDAVLHGEPESLARLRPDLPAELIRMVEKALRKDASLRYQHMADLAADLRLLLRQSAAAPVVLVELEAPRPGTRLGPYEILDRLGAGGMGDVHRARDPRLGHEVAIKVLPPAYAGDAERLRRFGEEARAAGSLNHPNLLAVYDVGTHGGSPYVVFELLEGETLRERLEAGALPPPKAVDCALQMARGLTAAHDKGLVHRDLKPENLFLTRDDRLKILDFGLAMLTRPETGASTIEGKVLGTVSYLSPEQVRGDPADHRSDLFSFGAILYEMLSGRRAFQGASAVETMSAILGKEPPEFGEVRPDLPPGLDRVVRHCLEKNPEARFQSGRDLAFHLETLLESRARAPSPARRRARALFFGLAILVLLGGAAVAAYLAGTRAFTRPAHSFQHLTFRRGTLSFARFAPGGQTIVYSAAWQGNAAEIFTTRPDSPESRALGLRQAELLAISPGGEMAVLLRARRVEAFSPRGTLARVPLAGGSPRELLENVEGADWSADGRLLVVRVVKRKRRLEFPIGTVLYETHGWIQTPRFSPKGDLVAFLDHPVPSDDGGSVAVVDLAGKRRTLSKGWMSTRGLAWSPRGDEIWFAATRIGARELYAVTLSGRERVVTRSPISLSLMDVSRDGRVLATADDLRIGLRVLAPGDREERDLSWLDGSHASDLSADGRKVLFSEVAEGAGKTYGVYLRGTDGSPAVRLGEGLGGTLSPDGRWALALRIDRTPAQIVAVPTRAGEPKIVATGTVHVEVPPNIGAAHWFPDGKRLLVSGREPGRGIRLYVVLLDGGTPTAITPEGVGFRAPKPISPDGRMLVGHGDGKFALYPVEGGKPRVLAGVGADEWVLSWTADGRGLYVGSLFESAWRVDRLDLESGRRDPWKVIGPTDRTGMLDITPVLFTPDAKSYAYCYLRVFSRLLLIAGLR